MIGTTQYVFALNWIVNNCNSNRGFNDNNKRITSKAKNFFNPSEKCPHPLGLMIWLIYICIYILQGNFNVIIKVGWIKKLFYQIKLKEQIQQAPVAEQPLRLDFTKLRCFLDVVSMGSLEKKSLCYSYYGWPFGCITHSSALLDHRGPCTYLTHQAIVLCSTVWVDLQ